MAKGANTACISRVLEHTDIKLMTQFIAVLQMIIIPSASSMAPVIFPSIGRKLQKYPPHGCHGL